MASCLILVAVSLYVYAWLGRRIVRGEGKVVTQNFDSSDLLVAGLLALWFVSAVFRGVKAEARTIHNEDIVNGEIVFLLVVAFLCSFMYFRGIDLANQFGMLRLRAGKVAGTGVVLLLSAYPIVGFASVLSQMALGSDAKPQELVRYFTDAAEKSNYTAIFMTILMGAVFAPVAEEFIFRGYFYGILKRHLGISAGILLNAVLFAAIHLNESSLAALFVLAICFTIAYEITGSIFVSMFMHSLFNFTNLCMLFVTARHATP